jgi:hypothetical protein
VQAIFHGLGFGKTHTPCGKIWRTTTMRGEKRLTKGKVYKEIIVVRLEMLLEGRPFIYIDMQIFSSCLST